MASYKGYNIKELEGNFRVLSVLKNRYGEADVEVGCGFYGKTGLFKELPLPDEIYDYEKYKSPSWTLEDTKVENSDVKVEQKSKFVL